VTRGMKLYSVRVLSAAALPATAAIAATAAAATTSTATLTAARSMITAIPTDIGTCRHFW
jgi:hypothetical protein